MLLLCDRVLLNVVLKKNHLLVKGGSSLFKLSFKSCSIIDLGLEVVHHIKCRAFVGDNTVEGLDEDLLYHTFPEMGSGTLLLSLELVVALPYDTAVLVCGVPDLGADVEDHRIQPKGTADKILDFFLRRKNRGNCINDNEQVFPPPLLSLHTLLTIIFLNSKGVRKKS